MQTLPEDSGKRAIFLRFSVEGTVVGMGSTVSSQVDYGATKNYAGGEHYTGSQHVADQNLNLLVAPGVWHRHV
jgi:hypothetical protein